jgi:hypothetical protein
MSLTGRATLLLTHLTKLIPDPWSLDVFVDRVARHFGIQIQIALTPIALASDTTGFTWPQGNFYLIVVSANISIHEREMTVFHELVHVLLEHPPTMQTEAARADLLHVLTDASEELVSAFTRHIPPDQLAESQVIFSGHGFDTPEEREAESVATQLSIAIKQFSRTRSMGTIERLFGDFR